MIVLSFALTAVDMSLLWHTLTVSYSTNIANKLLTVGFRGFQSSMTSTNFPELDGFRWVFLDAPRSGVDPNPCCGPGIGA